MELGDGGGGGESAAKSTRLPSGDADSAAAAGEDRLSALPDDILVLILRRLGTCGAARTSVLSRRWHRVWALLPELFFGSGFSPEPHQIGPAIQAHEAAIGSLVVTTWDAGPKSVAAWLPIAARRLYGSLVFHNLEREGSAQESDDEEGPGQRGAFEVPCLERATNVSLDLGFLGLAVPPAGVFARLTRLRLAHVRLYGPGDLGDVVTWPRCPCLQRFIVSDARGVDNHSDSLQQVELTDLRGLRQLNIVAPALKELKVAHCFFYSLNHLNQPVASITAPQLANLRWMEPYDPSSVHLGEMRHLRLLRPFFFVVYRDDSYTHNQYCLSLLRCFKVIEHLILTLTYLGVSPWTPRQPQGINLCRYYTCEFLRICTRRSALDGEKDIDDYHYVMEDMTMLPSTTILHLNMLANKHAFGASAFHVLRMCSGIRKLMLAFRAPTVAEAQTTCPPGCICGEHQNWETEHLVLKHLKEVEITHMKGSEHEVAFVKQLFIWGTALEKMMVFFDISVTESVAKELSQVLRSFARPEIRMEVHTYLDMLMMAYVPED